MLFVKLPAILKVIGLAYKLCFSNEIEAETFKSGTFVLCLHFHFTT